TETGPTAAAVWRGAIALPLLAIWALIESRNEAAPREAHAAGRENTGANVPPREARQAGRERARVPMGRLLAVWREPGFLLAGVYFAGDLALWHWSLLLTSIAASTLEASLAPLLVILFAWLRWKERPSPRFLGATVLAFIGLLL